MKEKTDKYRRPFNTSEIQPFLRSLHQVPESSNRESKGSEADDEVKVKDRGGCSAGGGHGRLSRNEFSQINEMLKLRAKPWGWL